MPTLALGWFKVHWFSLGLASYGEDGDVVFPDFGEDVARYGADLNLSGNKARLFKELAPRTFFEALTEFESSTWSRPTACAVRAHPLAEKNKPRAKHKNADSDAR